MSKEASRKKHDMGKVNNQLEYTRTYIKELVTGDCKLKKKSPKFIASYRQGTTNFAVRSFCKCQDIRYVNKVEYIFKPD